MDKNKIIMQRIAIADMLPAANHTRTDLQPSDLAYEQLLRSIDEFGYIDPIIWNKRTGNIVGGHQRFKVASQGTATWLGEADEISTSDTNFGQVTLNAHKLGTMIKVSQELLDDSEFPLDSFMADDFGRRLGVLEEEAFIIGDGMNKPTGFLTTAPTVTTAGDTITFDDVMSLFHELKPPYRNKAIFLCNDTTVKTLRQLKDNSGQYLWQASLEAGTPSTLLGHSVYVSRFMPEIAASAKVLAFGDFSYYWIADRKGRTFKRLDELFQTTDQIGFKATQRVDGKLILPEAVKVLKMGTT